MDNKTLQRRFWQEASLRSTLLCAGGVFCLFAPMGFLVDVIDAGRHTGPHLAFLVLLSGTMSVGYFVAGSRRWQGVLVGLAAFQLAVTYWSLPYFPPPPAPPSVDVLRPRLILDGMGVFAGIMGSYSFFMAFIASEGVRQVRMTTELTLAGEIHETLVPPVALSGPGFEVCGRSVPASRVGGDLVDAVVADGGSLTAYVVDVSGHGVPAGTLMAGLKSASRMRLLAPASIGQLLDGLNAVLMEIKRPNMFATAACVRFTASGGTWYSLAGHLPVLHYRAATGSVERLDQGQMALGILAGVSYTEWAVPVQAGDVLTIVTDGLTEVADRGGRELGLEGIETVLRSRGGGPLAELLHGILEAARAYGPQRDDQTALLVRIGPAAGPAAGS